MFDICIGTWSVEREWKGYGIQFLGLNLSYLTLMHEINYLIFKQMSMSTHNNTQTPISQQMSLRLSINHQFLDQLYRKKNYFLPQEF